MTLPLPRTVRFVLQPRMRGKDIDAHARAMHIELGDGQLWNHLKARESVRETFGLGKRTLTKKTQKHLGISESGVFGPRTYTALQDRGAYRPAAEALLAEYVREQTPPMPRLVYPHDKGFHSVCDGYIHETGGITRNMALDFMAAPGTPVLALEAGTISRTSGYDPATGLHGTHRDVFGWSVYLRCLGGFYYATHFGRLTVSAGQKVTAGQIIGYVGDWPRDRGRSHTHLGYSSFTRLSYLSIRKIQAVAAAPRVTGIAV